MFYPVHCYVLQAYVDFLKFEINMLFESDLSRTFDTPVLPSDPCLLAMQVRSEGNLTCMEIGELRYMRTICNQCTAQSPSCSFLTMPLYLYGI